MFEIMRRRIALLIAPELAGFVPHVRRPEPSNDRAVALRKLGDQVRSVADIFFAAGGCLPVWKNDREWLEGLGIGYGAYNAARMAITRLVRDETSGVTGPIQLSCLQLLSVSWPVGVVWPRGIPRPLKSKEAA